MKRNIKLEFDYPYAPEAVWKALTDRDELAAWLMDNDHVPVVGHKFQFRSKPQPGWDGIVDCEVLEVDEPRRLVWKWAGGSKKKKRHFTTVTWTLQPQSGGTKLILEHTGFAGIGGVMLSYMLESGWKKMSQQQFLDVLRRIAA